MNRDKYEVSLWEDILIPATFLEDGKTVKIPEHYDEEKIAVIGGSDITSPCKIIEPRLIENINGSNIFSFKMFLKYSDNLTGEKFDNPFLSLLTNERKLKVYWKKKWYDFVIKEIIENSEDKSVEYTCKDLYINELSKTGFNLIFDDELENNQGNIVDLAQKIVKNTDWRISNNNDTIQQTLEDPVYKKIVQNDFVATFLNHKDENNINITKKIKANDSILLFYSNFNNIDIKYQKVEDNIFHKGINYYIKDRYGFYILAQIDKFEQNVVYYTKKFPNKCSFIYNDEYETENGSNLLLNNDNYEVEVKWSIVENSNNGICYWEAKNNNNIIFTYKETEEVSTQYRGKKLVKVQKTKYYPLLEKYVKEYEYKQNDITELIYGYTEEEYRTADSVNNLLVNAKMFSSNNGWINDPGLTFNLYPQFDETHAADYLAKSYLKLTQNCYFNRGLQQSLNFLPDGLQKGNKYVFRIKAHPANGDSININEISHGNYLPLICNYTSNDDREVAAATVFTPVNGTSFFKPVSINDYIEKDGFYEITLECIKSIPRTKIGSSKMGFFLKRESNAGILWLEEIQFYEELFGIDSQGNNKRIDPGKLDTTTMIRRKYKYFSPKENEDVSKIDDLTFIYDNYEDLDLDTIGLKPIYQDNYEKIRSINIKNSNRFNLLQMLAETFQCWVDFNIEHDLNGKITLIKGVPSKTISFKEHKGNKVDYGFVYGIDLKGIHRTIESDQIATKVIVTPNENKFAPNGSCNIEDSEQNYSKQAFVLNFDYYIYNNLISEGQLNKDLYLTTPDAIGYYYYLNIYTTEHKKIVEDIIAKKNEVLRMESFRKIYEEQQSAAIENITTTESEILRLANVNTLLEAVNYVEKNPNNVKVKNSLTALTVAKSNKNNYETLLISVEENIKNLNSYIEKKESRKLDLEKLIDNKELDFFKKYGRYIQEGSWSKSEYYDPTRYYLDALSVASTSSKPKISYNISAIRLSSLEEFKNKVFHLGDISFIEDTEFFGFVTKKSKEGEVYTTPRKEQVLISEITSYFDTPNQDTFKIQNYKTQFEDLFQRITAITQNLQYSSGQYQRAANGFTNEGIINPETLQNSIARNENLVYSAKNDIIVQDSTGITLTDGADPSHKTKITSSGIFISTDGGTTWKNAVRGEGIATQYLTAGSINVNNINLYDGNRKTFRWDDKGINAFAANESNGVLLSKFVRFDQYGIYGINSADGKNFDPNEKTNGLIGENKIWDKANFGMTWRGFFIKNRFENGLIEISSDNDILIKKGNTERIKIGRILNENNEVIYGMKISNQSGQTVLETNDDGELWLRDKLEIGTVDSRYHAQIGKLGSTDTDLENRVIDINNKFIVYENGDIHAKGGKIGNMSIANIEDMNNTINSLGYQVIIKSDKGTIIKDTSTELDKVVATLTVEVYYKNGDIPEDKNLFNYAWYINDSLASTIYPDAQDSSYTFNVKNKYFNQAEVANFTCKVSFKGE